MAPDTSRHLHAVPDLPAVTPKPPTARGWWHHHMYPSTPIPMEFYTKAVNQLRDYDHLVDMRAVDATFENEVRPR